MSDDKAPSPKRGLVILAAVDFSEYSRRALLTAARLARGLGGELLILHVVHDPASAPGYYRREASAVGRGQTRLKLMSEAAAEIMESFIETTRASSQDFASMGEVRTLLIHGVPVFRILEIARREGASMIVVGSHGRTGPDHLMIGSKAERVVRLSPITVTVVK